MIYFQTSMIIDIASHWIHIWSSMLAGKTSHKLVDPSANPILRLYYTSRTVLFTFCAANELFYAGLYLLHFTEGPAVPFLKIGLIRAIIYATAPISIIKTGISLIQMGAACINVGIVDTSERALVKAATEEPKKAE
jgi:CDP-diacylglycerol--inositol 3-phosphatidyltransferase